MRRTIAAALLFVLLPLAGIELGLRIGVLDRPTNWYDLILTAACADKVDFVFAGSSRVAAAIHSEAFAKYVSQQIGAPVRVLNIGRGYTTLAEHDLVLRSLYEQCASSMEGATVFIEAGNGLPDFSTFRDSWVNPDEPWLIVPVIDRHDLVRMWMASDTPWGNKVDVSMRYSFQAVNYIDGKRRSLLWVGDQVVSRLSDRTTGGENGAADLSSAGGILTDLASVERARRLAVELASTTFKNSPRPDWPATVLMDVNALVRRHGGRVVVFRMPLSSVQTRSTTTALPADIEAFRRQAVLSDIDYLPIEFATTDEDFPDYWHLRNSRADEFSRRVAVEYMTTERTRLRLAKID